MVVERERESKGLDYNYDVIYIDPPYNTESAKNDGNNSANDKVNISASKFIYRDKFSRNGWLNMMNERLNLAKNLLKEDGVIFVSIDDNEQAYLKVLMDEIFGEENFIGMFSVENNPKGRKNSRFISKTNEYCLIFSKNIDKSYFIDTVPKKSTDMSKDENGIYIHNSGKRVIVGENTLNSLVDIKKQDKKWYSVYYNSEKNDIKIINFEKIDEINEDLINKGYRRYHSFNKNKIVQNTYTHDTFYEYFKIGKFAFKNDKIYEKHFNQKMRIKSILTNQEYQAIIENNIGQFKIDLKTTSAQQELNTILGKEKFIFPKNKNFILNIINLIPNKNARILDFFAGSGTTAHAVLELNKEDGGNRTFTLVTNNENNIAQDVTYERLYRINHGLSTNNETFEWSKKNQPYKQNLNVFELEYSPINIDQNQINTQYLIELLKNSLLKFGVSNTSDKDLINNLTNLYSLDKE
ncbi:site-specific DNA-methyltransferase [Mycoplasmopsis phocirhinis]|uniref:Site-specific DNA-methyltransferase n=1 Tax=Mycoplasmopsis phocirhinis TaxID=142650 RepID=A0A4P6MPY7_9BACT|nr:site-specific DNA-methyltransferase [Mycoplasmopsis phocirhinis]